MTESNQKWYVLRAMSGKEKQVKEYIDIELEKGGELSKYVSQVVIPTERVYVVRNGKKVIKERTFLPGYVLIEVALTREISGWLRNVPNVLATTNRYLYVRKRLPAFSAQSIPWTKTPKNYWSHISSAKR